MLCATASTVRLQAVLSCGSAVCMRERHWRDCHPIGPLHRGVAGFVRRIRTIWPCRRPLVQLSICTRHVRRWLAARGYAETPLGPRGAEGGEGYSAVRLVLLGCRFGVLGRPAPRAVPFVLPLRRALPRQQVLRAE